MLIKDLKNELNNHGTQLAEKANKDEVFSMTNMGQDIRTAMTGGGVGVVDVDTIFYENLSVNGLAKKLGEAIKIAQLTLIGGYVSSIGTITAHASRKYVEIPVTKGEIISITTYNYTQPNYVIKDSLGIVTRYKTVDNTPSYTTDEIVITGDEKTLFVNSYWIDYELIVKRYQPIDVSLVKNDLENIKTTLIESNTLIGFGDSMMAGALITGSHPITNKIATDTGLTTINYGVGGENSSQISARHGAVPMFTEPFTIPTDTSEVVINLVDLYGKDVNPRYASGDGINPCTINGIEGTIRAFGESVDDGTGTGATTTQYTYYFKRSVAGSSVVINKSAIVETYNWKNHRDKILVVWMGTNDGYSQTNYDVSVLIGRIKAMADSITSINKQYFVIGLGLLAVNTLDIYEKIDAQFIKEFGARFINYRDYLVKYGMSILGLTPTTEDTAQLTVGKVPNSLRVSVGSHHLIEGAYDIVADLVIERMKFFKAIS